MMKSGKQNRMSKASLPEFEGGSLQEYMEVLFSHQKNCEKTGKYMEAQIAKKRLVKMKGELENQRRQEMFAKFQEEKKQVQMAHLEEIAQFNNYWDAKIIQYHGEAQKMENESIEKHEQQLIEFEQQIQKSLGYGRKQSSEIINLRKIEENLAKQEKYVQAHQVQKRISDLQKSQYEKWNHTQTTKMKNLIMQLKNKQDIELSALRQKIEQGFEEHKRLRDQEEQKLIQKYQNFVKELENRHHQELIKFDKSAKLQSTINFSRTSNMSRTLQSRN